MTLLFAPLVLVVTAAFRVAFFFCLPFFPFVGGRGTLFAKEKQAVYKCIPFECDLLATLTFGVGKANHGRIHLFSTMLKALPRRFNINDIARVRV